jgi:hypothetical protein
MVIKFDDTLVQMPSTDKKIDTVFVRFDKQYFLVSEDEYKKSLIKVEKKDIRKEVSEINE